MTRRYGLLAAAAILAGCKRPGPGSSTVTTVPGAGDPRPIRSAVAAPTDEIEFSYALEIPDANGNPLTVQDTFKFRSGERFRFLWKANFPAYLYVFNRAPRSTSYDRLVPGADEAPMIGASSETAAPIPKSSPGWLRFDKVPGDEQMVLVVSRAAVPVLESQTRRYSVEEFDRILIALERSRRARSLRRFDEGHWHKYVAAGPNAQLAAISRLPLNHE